MTDDTLSAVAFSYSLTKPSISFVQFIYAYMALYQNLDDRLKKYDYTVFGLTVILYIVMSVINFVGHSLTPNIPATYMMRSAEMTEAESRTEGGLRWFFDGIVGTVKLEWARNQISIDF